METGGSATCVAAECAVCLITIQTWDIYGVFLGLFLGKLVFGPVCMHKLGGIGLLG